MFVKVASSSPIDFEARSITIMFQSQNIPSKVTLSKDEIILSLISQQLSMYLLKNIRTLHFYFLFFQTTQQQGGRYFMINNIATIYLYGKPYRLKLLDFDLLQLIQTTPTKSYCKVIDSTKIVIKSDQSEQKKIEMEKKREEIIKVGGLSRELQIIKELIDLTLFDYELCFSFGINPTTGILLWGNPGTGKTLLVKNITNSNPNIFLTVVNGPEFISANFGESEQKVFKKS